MKFGDLDIGDTFQRSGSMPEWHRATIMKIGIVGSISNYAIYLDGIFKGTAIQIKDSEEIEKV